MGRILVNLINLGKSCNYGETMRLQKTISDRLVHEVKTGTSRGSRSNTLLLLEHEPVFTVGIRSKDYSQQLETQLKDLGADFVRTNRGGLITFHGPGQLVAYPIIYLGDFDPKKSIKWFVHRIEATVISMVKRVLTPTRGQLKVSTLCEYPGVWIDGERKVAALGVHASRYVTIHGVAINCDTDLQWYDHIIPCGIQGKEVTSLSKELGHNFGVKEATPYLIEAFSQGFDCEFVSKSKDELMNG
jgi:lipoyl(octanoyl) transferase